MSIFGKKKDLIGEALVSIEPPKFDPPEVIKESKLKPTKCKHCHSIYQAQHKHIIRDLDYATLSRVATMTICPVCGCKNDVEFEGDTEK